MEMNCEAGFMCAQVSRTVHQTGGSCTGTNTQAANKKQIMLTMKILKMKIILFVISVFRLPLFQFSSIYIPIFVSFPSMSVSLPHQHTYSQLIILYLSLSQKLTLDLFNI